MIRLACLVLVTAYGAGAATLDVEPVWAGHPVGFCIYTVPPMQYVAYYDADREMTVAWRELEENTWQYQRLGTGVKWDSHNSITMTHDRDGRLHLAGNMHNDPLRYFRTAEPGDPATFEREEMVGELEQRVTYPVFYTLPDGRNLVDAGMISDIFIADGKVFFSLNCNADDAERLEPVRQAAQQAVTAMAGVRSAMVALTADPTLTVALVLLFLLVAGLFVESTVLVLLLTPIFLPIVKGVGIDPVHFGILMMTIVTLGSMTPPVGVAMYTVCSLLKCPVEKYIAESLPLIGAVILLIVLLTLLPGLVLFLPNLLM